MTTAKKTLAAGILNITAYDTDNVAGFGRVVGYGAIYFYIQDFIAHEDYRGFGLGTEMLQVLITQIQAIAASGAAIGLMSAINKEEFYHKFGFKSRPSNEYGAGMTLLTTDI